MSNRVPIEKIVDYEVNGMEHIRRIFPILRARGVRLSEHMHRQYVHWASTVDDCENKRRGTSVLSIAHAELINDQLSAAEKGVVLEVFAKELGDLILQPVLESLEESLSEAAGEGHSD